MTTPQHPPAVGGYFEFELPRGHGEYHAGALRYQSARAAFHALLCFGRPTAVWLPWYLCDSMLEAPALAGIPIKRYRLDSLLRPLDAEPGPSDWLLYVNYFGVCIANVVQTLARFGAERVVIDNSHAFFESPSDCLANIYSPRKFFGVPDGGYLFTSLGLTAPQDVDKDSVERCLHLLQRLDQGPEAGYPQYLAAESSLAGCEPRRMSALTQALLECIPYEAIRASRRRNFQRLHSHLAGSNRFPLNPAVPEAPLCYPYLPAKPGLRQIFHQRRIYLPQYWPEVKHPEFEARLAEDTLFLPCDQRMTPALNDRLLKAVVHGCHLDLHLDCAHSGKNTA